MALFGRPSEKDDARAEAYKQWLRRQNPFAIASLVLGVFSLIEFGALLVFGVAGIVLGFVALAQIRRTAGMPPSVTQTQAAGGAIDSEGAEPPRTGGRGLAWAGIVTSVVSLLIAFVLYTRAWRWFAQAHDAATAAGGAA